MAAGKRGSDGPITIKKYANRRLYNTATSSYVTLEHLRDMVKEDLIAERIAIDSYREMINYIGDRDTTTKRILESILAQEEEHADEFSDLLDGWIGK